MGDSCRGESSHLMGIEFGTNNAYNHIDQYTDTCSINTDYENDVATYRDRLNAYIKPNADEGTGINNKIVVLNVDLSTVSFHH